MIAIRTAPQSFDIANPRDTSSKLKGSVKVYFDRANHCHTNCIEFMAYATPAFLAAFVTNVHPTEAHAFITFIVLSRCVFVVLYIFGTTTVAGTCRMVCWILGISALVNLYLAAANQADAIVASNPFP